MHRHDTQGAGTVVTRPSLQDAGITIVFPGSGPQEECRPCDDEVLRVRRQRRRQVEAMLGAAVHVADWFSVRGVDMPARPPLPAAMRVKCCNDAGTYRLMVGAPSPRPADETAGADEAVQARRLLLRSLLMLAALEQLGTKGSMRIVPPWRCPCDERDRLVRINRGAAMGLSCVLHTANMASDIHLCVRHGVRAPLPWQWALVAVRKGLLAAIYQGLPYEVRLPAHRVVHVDERSIAAWQRGYRVLAEHVPVCVRPYSFHYGRLEGRPLLIPAHLLSYQYCGVTYTATQAGEEPADMLTFPPVRRERGDAS